MSKLHNDFSSDEEDAPLIFEAAHQEGPVARPLRVFYWWTAFGAILASLYLCVARFFAVSTAEVAPAYVSSMQEPKETPTGGAGDSDSEQMVPPESLTVGASNSDSEPIVPEEPTAQKPFLLVEPLLPIKPRSQEMDTLIKQVQAQEAKRWALCSERRKTTSEIQKQDCYEQEEALQCGLPEGSFALQDELELELERLSRVLVEWDTCQRSMRVKPKLFKLALDKKKCRAVFRGVFPNERPACPSNFYWASNVLLNFDILSTLPEQKLALIPGPLDPLPESVEQTVEFYVTQTEEKYEVEETLVFNIPSIDHNMRALVQRESQLLRSPSWKDSVYVLQRQEQCAPKESCHLKVFAKYEWNQNMAEKDVLEALNARFKMAARKNSELLQTLVFTPTQQLERKLRETHPNCIGWKSGLMKMIGEPTMDIRTQRDDIYNLLTSWKKCQKKAKKEETQVTV